jgi:hypothetical protein
MIVSISRREPWPARASTFCNFSLIELPLGVAFPGVWYTFKNNELAEKST